MEGKMVIAILLPQVLHLKFKRQRKIFFNVPDIDQTDSHREHPSESQRTPTLWPQRCELNQPPPLLPAPPSYNTTFSQLVLSFLVKLLA
uniref:Uncharacterized protein n=1 Tax=Triticum urartu TaxID=4572 RepID=A0A8R7QUZ9_TRIUA